MIEIGIDPVAFAIGSFEIRWYGIMVALAVVTGVSVPILLARKEGIGITGNQVLSVAIWAIPGGIIGARLIYVINNWGYFIANPASIVGGEGLGIFGAILGGTITGVIYARITGIPVGRLTDACAFGLILAQTVGRIGCTINGCCHGFQTSLPWGFVYTHLNTYCAFPGQAVHPTQVYELLFDLVVFALIWGLRNRLRVPGTIYLTYISVYSFGRFFISFLRLNEPVLLGLQQAQIVSLLVIVVAVPLMIYLYKKSSPEPASAKEG